MLIRASDRPIGKTITHIINNNLKDMFKLQMSRFLRELGDFESAMESFQKALMLNQNHIQSLQLRGMMLYHHGSLPEAIGNFKVLPFSLLLLVRFVLYLFWALLTPLHLCSPEVSPAGALQWGLSVHERPEPRGHGTVLWRHQSSN